MFTMFTLDKDDFGAADAISRHRSGRGPIAKPGQMT